jgi:hypothetical protein
MRRAAILVTMAAIVAGCGGSSPSSSPPPDRAASDTPTAAPKPHHGRELVYMSRNTWDAVPEDVAIYADGTVAYRQILHTKLSMHTRLSTLSPTQLSRLQGLLRHTRLAGADRAGVAAPRGRFSYLLRIDGRSIYTADGHLAPGVRPLITDLGRLQDKMLLAGGG